MGFEEVAQCSEVWWRNEDGAQPNLYGQSGQAGVMEEIALQVRPGEGGYLD